MRLGFCGVGRWASKIADQFRACGSEIVAYDRKNPVHVKSPYAGDERRLVPELPGFGKYQPWRDQLEDPRIDAIIAMADPETTTAVALACAAAGKPCMATKPLMLTDMPTIRNVFYVDFWRLWGDRWASARNQLREFAPRRSIALNFYGTGPVRSFPGSLDYGPHAMAFLLDAFGHADILSATNEVDGASECLRAEIAAGGARFHVAIGNGFPEAQRSISVMFEMGGPHTVWDEPPTLDKSFEIRAMCQSFLNDIHESNVSAYTLDLSIRGMRLLQQAREMAGAK